MRESEATFGFLGGLVLAERGDGVTEVIDPKRLIRELVELFAALQLACRFDIGERSLKGLCAAEKAKAEKYCGPKQDEVRGVAQCLVGASLELHVSRSTKYLDDLAFLITPRCPTAVMQADCTQNVRVVAYDVVYHLDDVPYFVGGLFVVEDDQAPQLCSSSCILVNMSISF